TPRAAPENMLVSQLVASVPAVSNCSSCCCPPGCECIWTDWIDVSYPDSSDRNSGDYETFENIVKNDPSWVCAKVENISCRAEKFPDIPIEDLGQKVECNVDTGLTCNNKDQPIGGIIPMPVCLNYEISVCCVPNIEPCITTTTMTTTTALILPITSITTALPSSTTSTMTGPPSSTTSTTTGPPSSTTTGPPSSTTTTTTGPPSYTTTGTPL
ncbi:MUC2 protein, partial [Psophia crepitans]|nr:MUC2 protein [Psophia crepitans]